MKEEMNELKVLGVTKILGKDFTMYGDMNNPLFLAKEVADRIKHTNLTVMLKSVDIDEVIKIRPKHSLGLLTNNNEYNFLTENGLYEVCMLSRKPEAKEMKTEVKKYLKQIRLTGGTVESGRESEFINTYFPSFAEDTKLSMVKDLLNQNQAYKTRIEQLEPQAKAYMDLMTAQGYLQFIDVAAMVEIGRNKLFEFLRRCKVLTKQSNFNIPYGRFTNNGMFKVITSKSESGHVSSVTMVSPKGLEYIYKLMNKKNVIDKFDTTTLLSKIQELEVSAS